MANKKISLLTERTKLTGNEMLPFLEGNYNGKIRSSLLTSSGQSGDDLQKIRSTKGLIIASYGNGVIRDIIHEDNQYYLEFDEPITYVAGDILNCTTYSEKDKKNYSIVIQGVQENYVIISEVSYLQSNPQIGDETILIGNISNSKRSGIVSLTAIPNTNIGLDCYSDITSTNDLGKLRVRVGDLDGIYDSFFPDDGLPSGYGLYGNNCFLVGDFLLRDGSNITDLIDDLRFEIFDIIYEESATNNYLSNASFIDNLDKWQYENNIRVFRVNQKLLYFNNNFYANKDSLTYLTKNNSRNAVRVKDSFIMLYNEDYYIHPTFSDNNARLFNIQFRYKVLRPGILTLCFKNEQLGEFEPYELLNYTQLLNETSVFNTLIISNKWNGTGDFYLNFTGDILIHSIILYDDLLGNLEEYINGLIEITNEKIQANYDKIIETSNKLEEYHSEFLFTAEQLEVNFDKKLVDTRNEITLSYTSAIELSAESLTAEFTKEITDAKQSITQEYTSAIELSAEQLTISFDQKVTHLDETLEEYHSEFLLSAQEFTTRFQKNELDITKLEDTTTGLTETTTNISTLVSEITLNLNSITLRVSSTELNINTLTNTTTGLEQTTAKLLEQISLINLDLDEINLSVSNNLKEITTLKDTTQGLTQSTQTISSQVAAIELEIDSINLSVSKNTTSIGDLLNTTTGLTLTTLSIQSDVAQIKLDTDKIESSVTSINSSITTINNSITGIDERVEELETASAGWVTTAEGNTLWAAKGLTELDIATAKSAAEAAASAAATAQSSANSAASAASAAQSTANSASSTASSAYSLASSAYSKATTNATAIQLTNSYISLISGNFDSSGNIINAAGWVTTAEANTLWVRKDNVISSINQTAESVEINAEKIDFVGKTVINGKFIVDTSGNVTLNNLTANDGTFNGTINATSGYIGAFKIDLYGLSDPDSTPGAYISIGSSTGTKFFRVNSDSSSAMCSIRSDSATILNISSYGTGGNGIYVLCNSSGYSIESYGNVLMEARNGEFIKIHGLTINTRTISSGGYIYTYDDFITFTNTSSITMTLPTPSACTGKILYFKLAASANVILSGTIMRSTSKTTSTSASYNGIYSWSYISNGSAWVEFSCS